MSNFITPTRATRPSFPAPSNDGENEDGQFHMEDASPSPTASKKKKTNIYEVMTMKAAFKDITDICTYNFMRPPKPQVLSKVVGKGLFHLIYVQNGIDTSEYFCNPLLWAITKTNPGMKETHLRNKTQIVAVVPRRMSKKENAPQCKVIYTDEGQGKTHKMHYFFAYMNARTPNKRKLDLELIAEVSEKC